MISNRITGAEPKTGNKGIIRSMYAQGLYGIPASIASTGLLALMKNVEKISKEDTISIKRAVSQTLTDTGLRDQGVKAVFVKPTKAKTPNGIIHSIINVGKQPSKKDQKAMKLVLDEVYGTMAKNDKFKNIETLFEAVPEQKEAFKKMFEISATMPMFAQIKTGYNALFLPHTKALMMPDNLAASSFHELGHVLNSNKNKLIKAIGKNRKLFMSVSATIGTIALLTKKRVDDDTPNKGIGKVTHFIKKNAGVLTSLAMLPVIVEEAMASVTGNGLAKKALNNKTLLSKIKLGNALGFATYAISALGAGYATTKAIQLKDKIQAEHEAKVAEKHAQKLNK